MNAPEQPGTYSITTVCERSDVKPGDEVTIEVFLIGQGDLGRHRLDIIPGHTDLTGKEVGTVRQSVAYENGQTVTGDEALELGLEHGYTLSDSGRYFAFHPEILTPVDTDSGDNTLALTPFGQYHDGHAPIEITLKTREDARAGDYTITLMFSYETDGEIKQTTTTVDIRVMSRSEQYQPYTNYAIIATAALGFVSLLTRPGTLTQLTLQAGEFLVANSIFILLIFMCIDLLVVGITVKRYRQL